MSSYGKQLKKGITDQETLYSSLFRIINSRESTTREEKSILYKMLRNLNKLHSLADELIKEEMGGGFKKAKTPPFYYQKPKKKIDRKRMERIKRLKEIQRKKKIVWVVLDNNREEFLIEAKKYFRDKYSNDFEFTSGDDWLEEENIQFDFMWYFSITSVPRVFPNKVGLIRDAIRFGRIEKIVLFVARNSININERLIDVSELTTGGEMEQKIGFRSSDFGFHFAFLGMVFRENKNKHVIMELEKYLFSKY